jgi:hypothetical protein
VQRAQLAQRIAQLNDLDEDLARMIEAQERGILLSDDEQRDIFGPDWNTAARAGARGLRAVGAVAAVRGACGFRARPQTGRR